MKKVLIFLGLLLMVVGCGKNSKEEIAKKFANEVKDCKGYHLTGKLEILRDDNKYTYDIDSSYQEKDNFKVSLINKTNNHEQIILKNQDGVYVVTPNLNKSFKFQSEWPYNNSQIYLLQPIVTDLENDKNKTFEKKKNGYVFTTKVDYTNDKNLKQQKIYLDKNYKLTKVEVLDNNKNIVMTLKITDIDMKATFSDNYFDLTDNYIQKETKQDESKKTETKEETKTDEKTKEDQSTDTASATNESVYPMYVPADTYLSSQEVVKTDNGERTIMTFAGESPFIVVQEAASTNKTTNYVSGDPYLILDTVGAITNDSVSWVSNNKEYYVVSDVMDIDELLTVAESINVVAVAK